jgi:hypothetical protein
MAATVLLIYREVLFSAQELLEGAEAIVLVPSSARSVLEISEPAVKQ